MLTLTRSIGFRFPLQSIVHPTCHMLCVAFLIMLVWTLGVTHDANAAPGEGTLFATDAVRGNLLTINPATGVGTVIGSTGIPSVPALAIDPNTGILYVGEGAGAPNLYTVNPTTAAVTLVGNTGLGVAAIGDLAFRTDGTLYAAVNLTGDGGTGADHLAMLDKVTGKATVIGPFGTCTGVTIPSTGGGSCTLEGMEAIAFDTGGTLWGALSRPAGRGAGVPGLYTINPTTGHATFVVPFVGVSGPPPSGGIVSLQFACDGTLYGGTGRALTPVPDGGRLVTINPLTGLFTFVGSPSATGGTSLGGLALQGACPNFTSPQLPGSLLVFPLFDIIGGNQTKIRITCNGATHTRVRVTYVCQPQGTSTTSAFCPAFDESWPCTPHQTLVIDVGTALGGACPTRQGYIVAFAEAQCTPDAASFNPSTRTCTSGNGSAIPLGNFQPISYNQLFGSYHLFYRGGANPPSLRCGDVPCSPPAAGPIPDVEAAHAIAIQSPQPLFTFLGTDTGGALSLSFGIEPTADYGPLPKVVETDFAAPGAALLAGPSTFAPFIPADTASGTELQTNIILLNLNYTQFGLNTLATMSVQIWNWFEVAFTSTHRFICWERIPIDLIDSRLTAAGLFGTPYGNIRFTPSPLTGATSPHLLGVLEEVSTVGRTIRTMIHSATAASPATFVTDIE